MRVALNLDTAQAIASELTSSEKTWSGRYFRNAVARPLSISLIFREPAPEGAPEFLRTLSGLIAQNRELPPTHALPGFALARGRTSDVLISFWPEVRESHEGVAYEIQFAEHGVQEIGWWALS